MVPIIAILLILLALLCHAYYCLKDDYNDLKIKYDELDKAYGFASKKLSQRPPARVSHLTLRIPGIEQDIPVYKPTAWIPNVPNDVSFQHAMIQANGRDVKPLDMGSEVVVRKGDDISIYMDVA